MGRPTKEESLRRKVLYEQGLKECSLCKDIKSLSDFAVKNDSPYGVQGYCKLCDAQKNLRLREPFLEYKKTLSCIMCGETNSNRLHFHHRDPSTKLFNIGNRGHYPMDVIMAEVAKCDVLCGTCHNLVEPRNPEVPENP